MLTVANERGICTDGKNVSVALYISSIPLGGESGASDTEDCLFIFSAIHTSASSEFHPLRVRCIEKLNIKLFHTLIRVNAAKLCQNAPTSASLRLKSRFNCVFSFQNPIPLLFRVHKPQLLDTIRIPRCKGIAGRYSVKKA